MRQKKKKKQEKKKTRRNPNMSEHCCAIGCDVRQGVNPVRSGSGSCDKSVAENFLRICYFLRNTKLLSNSLVPCELPGKTRPFSDVRADIFPSAEDGFCHFYAFLYVFVVVVVVVVVEKMSLRFSLFFFYNITKSTSDH